MPVWSCLEKMPPVQSCKMPTHKRIHIPKYKFESGILSGKKLERHPSIFVFNPLPHNPEFLMSLRKELFGNIVGKGENVGNQHFLLFPQCFLPSSKQISIFGQCLFCRLQMLSIWTSPRSCHVVKS